MIKNFPPKADQPMAEKVMKKIKFSLMSLVVLSLVFTGANHANAAALTWSADQTVDLSSPDIDLTIVSGSEATSLIVDTGSISVVIADGDVFTLTSASSTLSFQGTSTSNVSTSCAGGVETVTITGGPDGETIVITPTGVACTTGGGGGSSSGSKTVTTVTSTTYGTVIPGCGARTTGFSSSTGVSCVGNTGTATTPATTVIPGCGARTTGFSSSSGVSCIGNSAGAGTSVSATARIYNLGDTVLRNGSQGEAVKELQRFLNDSLAAGLVVDGIIGPKTIAVVKQWQAANGLVADGLVGPLTKAKINAQ